MILSNRRFELEMRGTARVDSKATGTFCIRRSTRKAMTAGMGNAIPITVSITKFESVQLKIDKNNARYASKIMGTLRTHHSFKEA
jgi:hypothetical protein